MCSRSLAELNLTAQPFTMQVLPLSTTALGLEDQCDAASGNCPCSSTAVELVVVSAQVCLR